MYDHIYAGIEILIRDVYSIRRNHWRVEAYSLIFALETLRSFQVVVPRPCVNREWNAAKTIRDMDMG